MIFYDVDGKGFPVISPAPVRYRVSCAPEPTRNFQTEKEPQVPAAAFTELVSEWHKVNGVRPQGAPVGMTVASDGAIWLVEDKNATVIRIDVSPGMQTEHLPCGARSDEQIDQLVAYVHTDQRNWAAPEADAHPARRKALRWLPFGLRASSGTGRQTRMTLCCGSHCPRTVGSIPGIRTRGGCERGSILRTRTSLLRRTRCGSPGKSSMARRPGVRSCCPTTMVAPGRLPRRGRDTRCIRSSVAADQWAGVLSWQAQREGYRFVPLEDLP